MDTNRIEEMLAMEWPQERDARRYLPAALASPKTLKPSVGVRPGFTSRSRFSFGAAAAALIVVIVGGTMLSGAWLYLRTTATPSPTATSTPTSSASITPTQSPSTGPTESVSPEPTDSTFTLPSKTYVFRPAPKSSPIALAGNATLETRSRTGTDDTTNLQWDFWEPLVTTPGRTAGAAISSNVGALLDSRVAELQTEWSAPQGAPPQNRVTLVSTFAVVSSAGPPSDPTSGFLTLRIDYTFNNPPWADAGPQWIDFLSYDLKTGKQISISDLFTDTTTAVKRLSTAAAADPGIAQWFDPSVLSTSGYEPKPENFAMWAPTRSGLQIAFGWMQLGSAVSGTPAFTVAWSKLSDLFKPNSYLAWYAAQLAGAGPSPSGALAHGTFALAGSMVTGEWGPNATVLNDGRILVVGLGTQVYDPATGIFSATTGGLPKVRSNRSTTLLQDGEVLVAGGADYNQTQVEASAELYNPKTGKFTSTGAMTTAREYQTATLLKDGRVLIAGGANLAEVTDANGTSLATRYLDSAEIYDPRTGKFTSTGAMTTARAHHTATLLGDGRVLIVGGDSDAASASSLASAEIYDPKTGRFTAGGSMATARGSHTATLLQDGRILIVGGATGGSNYVASAELYDPTTGKFTVTGSMTVARYSQAATLLPDGRVLVVGGDVGPPTPAEVYDPQTGTFSSTGTMILSRYATSLVPLPDGRVLVVGGDVTGTQAEIYQP